LEILKNIISDGFVLTDLKGNIIDSNEIFANYLETDRDDLISHNIHQFLYDSDYLFSSKFFEDLSSEGKVAHEARVKVKDTIKLFKFRTSFLYDMNHNPIDILFIVQELPKSLDSAAATCEFNFVNIFEKFLDAILIVDLSNRIIYSNAKAEELFKITRNELIKKDITEILPRIENYIAFPRSPKNNEEREFQIIETHFNLLNGEQRFLRVKGFPIIEGTFLIVSDRTESIYSEQKLKDSEEKYRFLVENAQEGIWIIDTEAKTSFVNQFMANMLGYSKDEMLEKSLFAFTDEKNFELTKYFLKRRQNGITENHDFEFLRKDGIKISADLKTSPIFDKTGKYDGAFAFVSDITEKRLFEQRLKKSEERYRLIIENANDLIFILNSNYEYELINEKTHLKILGYSKEDLMGKNALEFLHPDDKARAMEKLMEGFERGEGKAEIRARRKDGTYTFLEIRGQTFIDENGELKAVIIARDITNRKEIEEALKNSEEKFRTLFESSKDGIIFTDLNGNIIEANQTYLDILGYSKEEIKKFTYQQLTPRKWHEIEEVIVQKQIIARGYSDSYEKEYIRKDGTVFPINIKIWLIKDEKGNPKGLWGFVRDITEQKRAEEELRESEEKFRIITEQSFMGIVILQEDVVKYANQKLAAIFGFTVEEILTWPSSHYFTVVHPDDEKLVRDQSRKKQVGNRDVMNHYQFRGNKKSGEPIFLEVYSKTILLNGKPADLAMLNDITAKKEAETTMTHLMGEIKEQNQKLKELDAAKDEMLEIVSHELRTPLVSILGFTELLSSNNTNMTDEQIEDIRILRRNAARLNQLIEKIFNLEKMNLGEVRLKIESIDLQKLINSILGELNYHIKQKMHKIFIDIPPKFKVQADEELMHQVISNLLTNAIKYTPDQGTISVKVKKYGLKTLFSIKDTGIGITQEDLPRLFQKFQRLSSPEEKHIGDVKGIGLGLYLSKKIIELHGGKMWAESEGKTRGSTFYFELPNQC